MHLRPDMVRDEADDPLSLRWRKPLPAAAQAVVQPVDPKAAVAVEHDL
jgi:hypothetical protein